MAVGERRGRIARLAHRTWPVYPLTGVFSVVLGASMVLDPSRRGLAASMMFGLCLSVFALHQVFAVLGSDAEWSFRVVTFVGGVLSLFLGLADFPSSQISVLLMALWIGIGWLFRGFGLLVVAMSSAAMPATSAGIWLMILGAAQTIGAICDRHGEEAGTPGPRPENCCADVRR
ncbi:DUF308 domain-containing protein [Nocardia terpenica]|uniref:DUF308 domain-containing protein n=1 Tax=Nocardia terpenica TaxID=455432 RepID=UPI0012FD0746|nr:DUF308 domain-containing protein [Nocardia terpenica]